MIQVTGLDQLASGITIGALIHDSLNGEAVEIEQTDTFTGEVKTVHYSFWMVRRHPDFEGEYSHYAYYRHKIKVSKHTANAGYGLRMPWDRNLKWDYEWITINAVAYLEKSTGKWISRI